MDPIAIWTCSACGGLNEHDDDWYCAVCHKIFDEDEDEVTQQKESEDERSDS